MRIPLDLFGDLACSSPSEWAQRDPALLSAHPFAAITQSVLSIISKSNEAAITVKDLKVSRRALRRVLMLKHLSEEERFFRYAQLFLDQLHSNQSIDTSPHKTAEIVRQQWRRYSPYCRCVVGVHALRSMIGSVCETIVLLDRLLFIHERCSDVKTTLVSLFDPALSPRSTVVVALRTGNSSIPLQDAA